MRVQSIHAAQLSLRNFSSATSRASRRPYSLHFLWSAQGSARMHLDRGLASTRLTTFEPQRKLSACPPLARESLACALLVSWYK